MNTFPGNFETLGTIPSHVQLVGFAELRKMGIGSRDAILKMVRDGTLPWPYQVQKRKMWRLSDIEAFLSKLERVDPHADVPANRMHGSLGR